LEKHMPAAAEKVALTDRFLKALRPIAKGERPRIIWDVEPGLTVQVGAKGHPSFVVIGRMPGTAQSKWRKVGVYPDMTLAEAREAARDARKALSKGQDPKVIAEAARRAQAEAEREAAVGTFAVIAEKFDEYYRNTPGRGQQMRRRASDVSAVIKRELVPVWGERPVREITTDEVLSVITAIRVRGGAQATPGSRRTSGGPYAARHAFAAARLLFKWAQGAGRRYIPVDPCAGIDPQENLDISPAKRQRTLRNDEMLHVWNAAEATAYPYGPMLRLLLLTGARLREIAEASWAEVDLDNATLAVPPGRMKMRIEHVIPLCPAALAIVESLPRFTGGQYLFSTTGGRRAISGFSKFRAKFNKTLAETLAAAGLETGAVEAFTIHDFRRVVRSGLAILKVSREVAELVLAHQPQGLDATYNQYTYAAEIREALDGWQKRLLGLVASKPTDPVGNVVPIRSAK
jgi:integrase